MKCSCWRRAFFPVNIHSPLDGAGAADYRFNMSWKRKPIPKWCGNEDPDAFRASGSRFLMLDACNFPRWTGVSWRWLVRYLRVNGNVADQPFSKEMSNHTNRLINPRACNLWDMQSWCLITLFWSRCFQILFNVWTVTLTHTHTHTHS